MQTGVLDVVRSHLLLPFDLHADLQADGARHRRLVRSLLWERTHGDTGLGRTQAHTHNNARMHTHTVTFLLRLYSIIYGSHLPVTRKHTIMVKVLGMCRVFAAVML